MSPDFVLNPWLDHVCKMGFVVGRCMLNIQICLVPGFLGGGAVGFGRLAESCVPLFKEPREY